MSIVFGPVPSRRLGQSLGIDPIPFKTCNYNCVYCQLGRTTPLTNERKDFFPPQDIVAEVRAAMMSMGDRHVDKPANTVDKQGASGGKQEDISVDKLVTPVDKTNQIDYITFVGQGEPLLCASLGRLIREVKVLTAIPVAVITNGSLFHLPDVRETLRAADVVIPTLDAVDEDTFRRINRPWPRLHIAEIIDGLIAFRKIFNGRLWVEVMLVKGVNDTRTVLAGIADTLKQIRPDQVHLNIPLRPPAEAWVEPPDSQNIMRAITILGEVAPIVTPAEGDFKLANDMSLAEAVIEIIRRHPLQETQLLETLDDYGIEQVQTTLQALTLSGQARQHIYRGEIFWEYAGGKFATKGQ